MGSTGTHRQLRSAVAVGVAALLLVSCSAATSGSAVRDSTAAWPPSATASPDWSTAAPPSASALTQGPSRRPAPPSAPPTRTRSASSTGRPVGDLGLTEMISRLPCDGAVIVLLGSATTPRAYTSDVQQLLQVHPGSHYLRTDQACGSLAQRSDEGNQIYAVFYGPYDQVSKACEVLHLTGGDAQVRALTDSAQPLGPEQC